MIDPLNKARATRAANRARKEEEFICGLLNLINEGGPARTVWQLAYEYEPTPTASKVNDALDTDERFVEALNLGKVALPDRSLHHPKWVRHVIDRSVLPRVAVDEKLAIDLFPVPIVGDSVREADYLAAELMDIKVARRMTPRQAKQFIRERKELLAKMIGEDAQRTHELANKTAQISRLANEANRLTKRNSDLEKQALVLQSRLEVLERLSNSRMPVPDSKFDEFRPHS